MCVVTIHKWSNCNHVVETKQCWRTADEAQYRARRKRWRLYLNCFSRFDNDKEPCQTTYKTVMDTFLCPDCYPTLDQVKYASDHQLVGEQRGRVEQARLERAIREQARREEEVRRQVEQQAEHFRMRQQQLEEIQRHDRKMQERRERELKKMAEAEQMVKEAKERARRSAEQYGWTTTTALRPPAPLARKPVGSGQARKPVASSLPRYADLPPVEYAAYLPAPLNIQKKVTDSSTYRSKTLPRPVQAVPATANVAKVPSGHVSANGRGGSPSIAHRRGNPVTPIVVPPPPPPRSRSQAPKPKSQVPKTKLQDPVDAAHAQRQADRAQGKKTYDPINGVELIDGEDGYEYGVMMRGGVVKHYRYVGEPKKLPTMDDFILKPKPQVPKPKLQNPIDAAHAQRQADRARGKKTYDPVTGVELVDREDGYEYGAMNRGGVIRYYRYVGAPDKPQTMDDFVLQADGSFKLAAKTGKPIRKGDWRDVKGAELAAQVKPRAATGIARDYVYQVPTYRSEKSDQYGEPLPSDGFLSDMEKYN